MEWQTQLCFLIQKHFLASFFFSLFSPSTRASVRCGNSKKPSAAGILLWTSNSTTWSYLFCCINRKERLTCWPAIAVNATRTFWTGLYCWIFFFFFGRSCWQSNRSLGSSFPFPLLMLAHVIWSDTAVTPNRMHPTACGRRRRGWYSTQGKPPERRGSTAGLTQDKTKKTTEKWKGKWAGF